MFFNLILAMFGPLLIVRFEQQDNIKRYSGFHWSKLELLLCSVLGPLQVVSFSWSKLEVLLLRSPDAMDGLRSAWAHEVLCSCYSVVFLLPHASRASTRRHHYLLVLAGNGIHSDPRLTLHLKMILYTSGTPCRIELNASCRDASTLLVQ